MESDPTISGIDAKMPPGLRDDGRRPASIIFRRFEDVAFIVDT